MADAVSPDNFPPSPAIPNRPTNVPADRGSAGMAPKPADPGSSSSRNQAIPASHRVVGR